ncbi:MAG: DUF885 domain-containing protein [Pseudomonadota bacterium]|nr:MAG: DUF885 domain-containing protein [Pseudomonadota bacterium]
MLKTRIFPTLVLAASLLAACSSDVATTADADRQPNAAAAAAQEDARLLEFLDRAFDESLELEPQSLTALGIKKHYDRLNDFTDEGARKELELAERHLEEMKAQFDPERLSPQGRLSYRLFEKAVERQRLAFKWRLHRHPVTNASSPAGEIPVFLINQHRVDSVDDARAYVSRLAEVERVMREVSEGLEARAKMGIIAPKFTFEPVMSDARKVISGAPFDKGPDSTLLADFRKKVEALDAPEETKKELIEQAREALAGPFKRGYEHLLATLQTLSKQAKGNDGAWSLPQGDEYYAAALRLATTTDLTPDEIHEIGLREVERIHREMEAIKERIGFKGTLQQFMQHVKTDPKLQYPNTEAGKQAYLRDAQAMIDQVMAAAPKLFHRLPKAALEVRAVEPWRESTAPVAFYNIPAPDGSRPGIYYVNLSDMRQVLKAQVEGISYHEGAPGHHFQIAFAQELEGLPKFRRFGGYTAYVEGWGLYAEQLGKELGFYQDPYSDFGRLSTELWRAVRLVVDTGLHAKRWTREQAIEYFRQNSMLSERDIVKEVERYIVWPGQATSYKIGQLEISRLRAEAEAALGDAFDVRDFHEVVLGNGALPLDVLREQVEAYIASASAGGASLPKAASF